MFKVNIKDLVEKYHIGEGIPSFGLAVAERLVETAKKMRAGNLDWEIQLYGISYQFEEIETIEELNSVMKDLHDWAGQDSKLLIEGWIR